LVMDLNVDNLSTRLTFIRSLSTDATPNAVFMSVGHREHNVTVIADITRDFGNQSLGAVYNAETTMVTIGNHASGDTGLKICISGLSAPLNDFDKPQAIPIGIAITVAIKKPTATVNSDVQI